MRSRRGLAMGLAALLPLIAHAACSATNGDPIANPVFDASALDVGANPRDPEAGKDGAALEDAAQDAPVDSAKPPDPIAVHINEVFVDNDGLGDGSEFIELRAAAGTPVDDLTLRILKADGIVKYEGPVGAPGQKVGPGGLWVVGGAQTFKLNVQDRVDRVLTISTPWGLDNSRGAVQLLRGSALLDVVGYAGEADAGALPPPPAPPTATSEGKPVVVPDRDDATPPVSRQARSFGRKPAGADTNDNTADFCTMTASPGFAQKPCE